MKKQTIALLTIFLFTGLAGVTSAKAEAVDRAEELQVLTNDGYEKNDSQEKEKLINKVEAAQKEQMMKFVQKKHLLRESDYI